MEILTFLIVAAVINEMLALDLPPRNLDKSGVAGVELGQQTVAALRSVSPLNSGWGQSRAVPHAFESKITVWGVDWMPSQMGILR